MAKSNWKESDRPFNSLHTTRGGCNARVMRAGTLFNFEWSTWKGGVLNNKGYTKTKAGAKRAAERALNRCAAKPPLGGARRTKKRSR